VRKSSSYFDSLQVLNERFKREGKPEIQPILVPDSLEDEDMMQMLDAGLIELMVVDDWKAHMWSVVLPKVKVRPDLVLRANAQTGWAIRKDSPKLLAEIDDFFRNWAMKQGVADYRMNTYMKRVKELKDPTAGAEYKRFREILALFEKYGSKYNFDPLMLAAQGYQESQLNQSAKSRAGAVGIMQLMPATGKQMNVGDIHQPEANIDAGVKYMRFVMNNYFSGEPITRLNKALFTFASYNAGIGRVEQLRREAKRRGLDPNVWFGNVEYVAGEKIGQETVTYVSNIYKYYLAYRLLLENEAAERAAAAKIKANLR
jgi:membrane-bound lytic murein transglycosylase MltF